MPPPVAAALRGPAVGHPGRAGGPDAIRVDATSIEAGERGIPAVIAGCGARMVSCEPVAADLESAFLALTGATRRSRDDQRTEPSGIDQQSGTGRPRPPPPMSLWRLEWLRLVRTPRALALGAVYLSFGLIEPVLTK